MVAMSERQVYRWLADESFIELVAYRGETNMDLFGVEIYRALLRKVRLGDTKAIELGMKRMGVLKEIREISSDVKVEVTSLAGKSQAELLAEIAMKEAALLDTVEVAPNDYHVVTDADNDSDHSDADSEQDDAAWVDAMTAGRYVRDDGEDAAE